MAHVNPKEERRSKAPYNFVRLPNQPKLFSGEPPPKDKFSNEHYSGYIHFTITTKTDLYVRCAPYLDKVEQERDTDSSRLTRRESHRQDFFHHGILNEPVIPGSSLRGMIRNLVEIFSQSRMRYVSDKRLVYRAIANQTSLDLAYQKIMIDTRSDEDDEYFEYPSKRLKAGYLEKHGGNWKIRPAMEYPLNDNDKESFNLVETTDVNALGISSNTFKYHQVRLIPGTRIITGNHGPKESIALSYAQAEDIKKQDDDPPKNGYVDGLLITSTHIGRNRRWYPVVFERDTNRDSIDISQDLWKLYVEDYDEAPGKEKKVKLLEVNDPVFYVTDDNGKLIFFGPTMMFRIPHSRRIRDAVPEHLTVEHNPEKLDLVERLFGTVRKDKALLEDGIFNTVMGRVTFHDAHWNQQGGLPFYEPSSGRKTPKILSSPKPTAFQHYVEQPEPDDKATLVHWSHEAQPKIRGYKLYWHRELETNQKYEAQLRNHADDKQYTVIRPVKDGVTFSGKISFENLAHYELGALLTTLDLPEGLCHKLGMGKPYGLGSIRINIQSLNIINHKKRYETLFKNDKLRAGSIKYFPDKISPFKKSFAHIFSKSGNIWDVPQIQDDLKPLLDFDNARNARQKDYANVTDTQWRERKVLPNPRGVLEEPEV
jgi:CRISPR-associated protein (TIGR03986 family)